MFVRHKYGFELEKIVFVSVLVSGNLHRKKCAEQVAPKIAAYVATSIIGSFSAAVVVTRTTTADSTIRSNRGNGNGMAGRVRS